MPVFEREVHFHVTRGELKARTVPEWSRPGSWRATAADSPHLIETAKRGDSEVIKGKRMMNEGEGLIEMPCFRMERQNGNSFYLGTGQRDLQLA